MSAVSNPAAVKPMKVDQGQLLGTIWSLLAIAIICAGLRLVARIRTFKTLLSDDYFVVAALIFAIANAIIWQIFAPSLYYVMDVSAGLALPGADFGPIAESYWKATLGVIILYYSALWAVKVSFLLLFKRLGTNVQKQNWLWWPVFLFTLATYFACIGDIYYPCLTRPMEYVIANCATPAAGNFNQVTLKVNCAWDVLTDFLIMLIPFRLLHGTQMSIRKRFMLTGIFSLVIVTMIFSILRTALVGSPISTLPDSSWLYLWSAIEVSVAIMIASVASFRNLFSRENSSKPTWTPPHASNLFLRQNRPKPKNRFMAFIDTIASSPDQQSTTYNVNITSTADQSDTQLAMTNRTKSNDTSSRGNVVYVKKEVSLTAEQV